MYLDSQRTHQLAGVYHIKADFFEAYVCRRHASNRGSVVISVDHIYVSGDTAIVEMTSISTAMNRRPYAAG